MVDILFIYAKENPDVSYQQVGRNHAPKKSHVDIVFLIICLVMFFFCTAVFFTLSLLHLLGSNVLNDVL